MVEGIASYVVWTAKKWRKNLRKSYYWKFCENTFEFEVHEWNTEVGWVVSHVHEKLSKCCFFIPRRVRQLASHEGMRAPTYFANRTSFNGKIPVVI